MAGTRTIRHLLDVVERSQAHTPRRADQNSPKTIPGHMDPPQAVHGRMSSSLSVMTVDHLRSATASPGSGPLALLFTRKRLGPLTAAFGCRDLRLKSSRIATRRPPDHDGDKLPIIY
jgi:hypothetical protein